ncbi:MAG: cytochrome c [Nitrolancea sp.]
MIRAVERLAQAKARLARARPRLLLLTGVSLLLVIAVGCDSTNTYPIDFYSGMHYSDSWHAQEPPRLDSPAGAIQVNQKTMDTLAYGPLVATGNPEPTNYTLDDAKNLKNPLQASDANLKSGSDLFTLNCMQCHGQKGLGLDTPNPSAGDAFMIIYFKAANQTLPKDQQIILPKNLTSDEIKNLSDGEIYYYVTNGLNHMPPFGNLLTPEQRWQLVLHIRQLQGQ